MKPHQENPLPATVLRHLQHIQHTQKPRSPCQLRRNIGKPNQLNRIDLDLAFVHGVSVPHLHSGTVPEPNAARNLPAPNPVAQLLGERHAPESTARPELYSTRNVRRVWLRPLTKSSQLTAP